MRSMFVSLFTVAVICTNQYPRYQRYQPTGKELKDYCESANQARTRAQNLTIICRLKSNFGHSLNGIIEEGVEQDLVTVLGFANTTFNEIPTPISDIGSLDRLSFLDGKIRVLNEELCNLANLTFLEIRYQLLESIHEKAFNGLHKLRQLILSNNLLSTLNLRVFNPLTELNKLDLSFNALKHMDGAFQLRSIQHILLNNNNLHCVEDLFDKYMWSVRELDISNNMMEYLHENAFRERTSGIRSIILRNTGLKNVHPNAFQDLKDLRYLDLSFNKLEAFQIHTFSHNLNHLRLLYLNNNQISSVHLLFAHIERLEEIHLDSNNLGNIENNLSNFTYLRKIFLDHNNISLLHSYSFQSLTSLVLLSIQFNKLSILEKGCFSQLSALRKLYLSSNFITHLNGSLNTLDTLELLALDGNPLKEVDKEDFAMASSLKCLLLNSTGLKTLGVYLGHMNGLRYLDISNNNLSTIQTMPKVMPQIVRLGGNPWVCDCKLKLIFQNLSYPMPNITCYFPENVRGMSLQDIVSRGDEWINNCPPGCSCFCISNHLAKNVYVNCSAQNLTMTPSLIPKDAAILDLSKNHLTTLTYNTCMLFNDIDILNIEDNMVSSLDTCLIKNVTTLKLAKNALSSPQFLLTKEKLEKATLSGNNWTCNCDTLEFRIWLLSHKDIIVDFNNISCGDHHGSKNFNSLALHSLTEDDLCPNILMTPIILIALVILGFLLLLTCLKILYTHYSLNVKIWLYSKGFTFVKEHEINQDKRFDAFISYSSHDEPFVINALVPGLEDVEPHYSLCLHYRHFVPGEYIQDNILSAVQCSCRTIIVLSKNFLNSEWCRLEFRVAYAKLLQDQVNRIVLIKYGDLPPLSEIDPAIRTHMESTTYLTWGERAFWKKLHYCMPKNRVSQNLNNCGYHELIII